MNILLPIEIKNVPLCPGLDWHEIQTCLDWKGHHQLRSSYKVLELDGRSVDLLSRPPQNKGGRASSSARGAELVMLVVSLLALWNGSRAMDLTVSGVDLKAFYLRIQNNEPNYEEKT